MSVYELIHELSQYKADSEIRFHVNADFKIDVEMEFDRESPSDVQNATVDVNFDEYVDFSNIVDREAEYVYRDIVIHLTYQD